MRLSKFNTKVGNGIINQLCNRNDKNDHDHDLQLGPSVQKNCDESKAKCLLTMVTFFSSVKMITFPSYSISWNNRNKIFYP